MAILDLPVPGATCDNCFRGRRGHPLDHEGSCEREGAHPEWVLVEGAPRQPPPDSIDPSGLPPGRMVITKRTLYFCSTACSMAHGQWERAWDEAEETCTVPDGEYDKLQVKLTTGRYLVLFLPQAMLSAEELAEVARQLSGIEQRVRALRAAVEGSEREHTWWESPNIQLALRILGIKAALTAATIPLIAHSGLSLTGAWCVAFLTQMLFEYVTLLLVRFIFGQSVTMAASGDDKSDEDESG